MQDATIQGKILFFSNEKERKLYKRRKREGEGGWCLTFFKGIINSLTALVNFMINSPCNLTG